MGGRPALAGAALVGRAARMSTLRARIQAGNSNSTQADIPVPISSTSAVTSPATTSRQRDTIEVFLAIVTVLRQNTAAIRIA